MHVWLAIFLGKKKKKVNQSSTSLHCNQTHVNSRWTHYFDDKLQCFVWYFKDRPWWYRRPYNSTGFYWVFEILFSSGAQYFILFVLKYVQVPEKIPTMIKPPSQKDCPVSINYNNSLIFGRGENRLVRFGFWGVQDWTDRSGNPLVFLSPY